MLEEETQHFFARVWPLRIGVGTGGTTSRPGGGGPVNVPMLGDCPAARVGNDGACIGMPVGYPTAKYLRRRTLRFGGLLDNSVAILWVHRGVAIAVENDGRHLRSGLPGWFVTASLAHGDERGGKIAGGAAGEARMNADGGVQIGVRRSHDGGTRPAGRQTAGIDALRIDRIVPHDLPGDAGDKRGFALASLLVIHAEPVPAFRLIGCARLLRVDNEAVLLFRQEVHPCAGREIVGRLGAAMKHDDQGKRYFLITAWDE